MTKWRSRAARCLPPAVPFEQLKSCFPPSLQQQSSSHLSRRSFPQPCACRLLEATAAAWRLFPSCLARDRFHGQSGMSGSNSDNSESWQDSGASLRVFVAQEHGQRQDASSLRSPRPAFLLRSISGGDGERRREGNPVSDHGAGWAKSIRDKLVFQT